MEISARAGCPVGRGMEIPVRWWATRCGEGGWVARCPGGDGAQWWVRGDGGRRGGDFTMGGGALVLSSRWTRWCADELIAG